MRRTADSIITREVCEADAPGAHSAVTDYRVLHTDGAHSVILASPVTGRTHQIRVHLTSVGCPLCGDTLYGSASDFICRHALHAAVTEFPHPADDRMMRVTAPLPADIQALIAALFPDSAEKICKELPLLC